EPADQMFLARRREQHEPGLRARKPELDPALRTAERRVGDDAQSEFLRVELQRTILIRDGHARELDPFDHRSHSSQMMVTGNAFVRKACIAYYGSRCYSSTNTLSTR